MRTPWRVGVSTGLVFGAVMGLSALLLGHAPTITVLAATIVGAGFGSVVGLVSRRPLRALAGLSLADRAMVMRTAKRGLPTSDSRLAPAVVRYTEALRRTGPRWVTTKAGARGFVIIAGVQLVVAGIDAPDGNWSASARRIPAVIALVMMPGMLRRSEQRLDRAEQSARALLDPP